MTNSPVHIPSWNKFVVAWEIQIITYDQNNVSLEFWDHRNQVNASKYKVGKCAKITKYKNSIYLELFLMLHPENFVNPFKRTIISKF